MYCKVERVFARREVGVNDVSELALGNCLVAVVEALEIIGDVRRLERVVYDLGNKLDTAGVT